MTKKELEARVQQLENEINNLRIQLVSQSQSHGGCCQCHAPHSAIVYASTLSPVTTSSGTSSSDAQWSWSCEIVTGDGTG